MDHVLSALIGIGGFLLAFGLAVFIHELGHFLAAKMFKVPVERFVIGFDKDAMPFMPRCIWEKEIGGTIYGLALVPLGGYVKMTGTIHPEIEKYLDDKDAEKEAKKSKDGAQAEEPVAATHDDEAVNKVSRASLTGQAMIDQGALYRKPFWQKTIIYSAGVFMNLVLAAAILTVQAVKGQYVDAPLPAVVGWQAPGSFLTAQGILEGDRLTAVNGTPVETNEDYWKVLGEVSQSLPEDEEEARQSVVTLAMTFERGGETFEKTLEVPWKSGEKEPTPLDDIASLISRPAYVEYAIQNRPAYKAGIRRGDTITDVDAEPVNDWGELVHILRGSLGKSLDVKVDRAGETLAFTLKPMESTEEDGVGQIGIVAGNPEKVRYSIPFSQAIVQSPVLVYENTIRYVLNLKKIGGRLLHGEINKVRQDLGGPVAIAQMAGYHANLGFDDFLRFLVMLNIALAVMNLLPYPVLDGGHIVLAAWEAVFRAPMSPKILVPVFNWGLISLLVFVVLVTLSDFIKMF
ncbi:MAG: regulator of sigma protease [Candidatus Sumerlaeota bacterium]|nr:regulator of sigma protease [Candidatus Sumerlaeota bacterium]